MDFQQAVDARREELITLLLTSVHPELQTCLFSDTQAKKIALTIDQLISQHVLWHMSALHTNR